MFARAKSLFDGSCFLLDFWSIVAGGIASAEATRGLSDRPLDPFGADTPMQLGFNCCFEETKGTLTNWSNNKNLLCWSTPKVSKGRSESPLVAPAGAKSLRKAKAHSER
jgi:hypothetical protein